MGIKIALAAKQHRQSILTNQFLNLTIELNRAQRLEQHIILIR